MAFIHAYIDEAGDEGFTTPDKVAEGSTEWLLLAGVMVREEDDLAMSHVIDKLREKLNRPPPKPLHFQNIRRHADRKEIARTLADEDFTIVAVAIWKPGITSAYLQQPPHLYNYAARFLIERMSWHADDQGRRLKLYFENRAATSYTELQSYMDWIQKDPNCSIREGCVEEYAPLGKTHKLIQVADLYASALWQSLEPDKYGDSEESYLLTVKHQFCGGKTTDSVLSCGLKVFPDQGLDRDRYPWSDSLR